MKEVPIVMIMSTKFSLIRIKLITNLMLLNNQKMMSKIMKKKLTDHLLKRLKLKFNSSKCSNRNLEQLKKKSKLDNSYLIVKSEIQFKHVKLVELQLKNLIAMVGRTP